MMCITFKPSNSYQKDIEERLLRCRTALENICWNKRFMIRICMIIGEQKAFESLDRPILEIEKEDYSSNFNV